MKSLPRVDCDESGFSSKGARIDWAAVLEVFAYKQDWVTFDDLCLGFRTSDDGTFWNISEESRGYQELLAELPLRFPGIRTDWFEEVVHPAFATNRTTLWGTALPG